MDSVLEKKRSPKSQSTNSYKISVLESDSLENKKDHKNFNEKINEIDKSVSLANERIEQIKKDTGEIKESIEKIKDVPRKKLDSVWGFVISSLIASVIASIINIIFK